MAILLRHVNEPMPSAISVNPHIDPAISNWIAAMTAREPGQRTQTAGCRVGVAGGHRDLAARPTLAPRRADRPRRTRCRRRPRRQCRPRPRWHRAARAVDCAPVFETYAARPTPPRPAARRRPRRHCAARARHRAAPVRRRPIGARAARVPRPRPRLAPRPRRRPRPRRSHRVRAAHARPARVRAGHRCVRDLRPAHAGAADRAGDGRRGRAGACPRAAASPPPSPEPGEPPRTGAQAPASPRARGRARRASTTPRSPRRTSFPGAATTAGSRPHEAHTLPPRKLSAPIRRRAPRRRRHGCHRS